MKKNLDQSYKEEKSFGYLFAIFFFLVGLYPLINGNDVRPYLFVVSSIFLIINFVYPVFFTIPNKLWIKLGNLLGIVTTPIIISLIYVVSILPVAILLKIFRKDLINKNIKKHHKSYWITRKNGYTDFDNQS